MAIVRAVCAEDLPGLLALLRHLSPADPTQAPAAAEAAWAALLASELIHILVAEQAGALVASCTLVIVPNLTRGARPYALIENVVTHEAHRRQGLGRAVLDAAVAQARAAGCYRIGLATGSRQESTLRFYESAGFTRDAKTWFEIRPT